MSAWVFVLELFCKLSTHVFYCLLNVREMEREEEKTVLTVQEREDECFFSLSFPVSNNDSFHHHLALTPFCLNYC